MSMRVQVRVRRPVADALALVEPSKPFPLDLDFVDLLDLGTPLLYGQVRPVGQALSA